MAVRLRGTVRDVVTTLLGGAYDPRYYVLLDGRQPLTDAALPSLAPFSTLLLKQLPQNGSWQGRGKIYVKH